jgi:hypothetical protein
MRLLPERLDIRKNRTVWNKEKELVDRTEHDMWKKFRSYLLKNVNNCF